MCVSHIPHLQNKKRDGKKNWLYYHAAVQLGAPHQSQWRSKHLGSWMKEELFQHWKWEATTLYISTQSPHILQTQRFLLFKRSSWKSPVFAIFSPVHYFLTSFAPLFHLSACHIFSVHLFYQSIHSRLLNLYRKSLNCCRLTIWQFKFVHMAV